MEILLLSKLFLTTGAVFGFASVASGAIGSHRINQNKTKSFEIAVRYLMYHALTLGTVGITSSLINQPLIFVAGWLFVIGTILFSGSLFALTFHGANYWSKITPVGGIILLIAWICFAYGILYS